MKTRVPRLRRLSADAIIERARNVLGSVVLPIDQLSCPLTELPPSAEQPEPDLEETLENSPLVSCRNRSPLPQDIWMSYRAHRKQPIILSLDTSLSMTGEKLALTAVALAVVLLQFPDDSIGIIAFENEAAMIKHPEERVAVLAQGYTHLEDGMAAALKLLKETRISGQARPASTVLLTDGKYTAGRDPAYLASRFPHLIVLKMGQERASLELCRELARKGSGLLREVGELEALPVVMYGVVKDLLRGRSFS